MSELILELFSEEIPARMQVGAARDLERMASDRLKDAGLEWRALRTFAGPRRLTLWIDGLPAATPDRSEEVKGPKTSAPEQALDGFLRKTGLRREQLVERDGVLFAVIDQKGRPTSDVVAEMVEQVVRSFPWPKSMRWGDGTLRWVRPLKRILCVLDGEIVPFEIDGVASGNVTEGHRFMGSGEPFEVVDFDGYRGQLADEFVRIDSGERAYVIEEAAHAACRNVGLELVPDQGLLDEVAGLAEWPTPILGEMDPQFLDLPPEVVRLSMKVHQKYFAVRDPARDGLAPNFVVVANVEASDGGKALAAGNSRVLSARLNDARFFWDEDRKPGAIDGWLEKLKGVTFHAKLGTLAERGERIEALAREIAPMVGADPDAAALAARYAKADLASGMVGEFPELQGIMGGYYLREAGEDAVIVDAVRDHYKPQGPNDTAPTAPETVAVALADKLDTLVGFFAIDEKPTGSKDPYALRRAALGVIRLILENDLRVPIRRLAFMHLWLVTERIAEEPMKALEGLPYALVREAGGDVEAAAREAGWEAKIDTMFHGTRDLVAFFVERLKVLLRDGGRRHDLVDAIFALGDDDMTRVLSRIDALSAFLATEDGTNLLAGYKRASNILKAEEKKGPLPTGLPVDLAGAPAAETDLIAAASHAAAEVEAALSVEDFDVAMEALARLRAPVDAFFEAVLVNSDVAEERENRLRLLGRVREVMGQVADFGQVTG
ncbi:glycine--tRNA ligase subunit beta [Brevundimonas aveniformis]|uniref:glycine--tRNA ligase subunit beta n=1 Tax=Brevundimonas aveniformis TaxID=370977 RepID=UPI00041D8E24|nr:glycine--tRNA ligase subunit beta [Brevundimonas aveniformis]